MSNEDYLLVIVETNKKTIIELMSTIFLYPEEITPNPSSTQLFLGKNKNDFILNFPKDYMVMVNLICVGGSAEIFWDNNPENKYYLKGRDDRLSITSEKSGKDHKLRIIGNNNKNENDLVFIYF